MGMISLAVKVRTSSSSSARTSALGSVMGGAYRIDSRRAAAAARMRTGFISPSRGGSRGAAVRPVRRFRPAPPLPRQGRARDRRRLGHRPGDRAAAGRRRRVGVVRRHPRRRRGRHGQAHHRQGRHRAGEPGRRHRSRPRARPLVADVVAAFGGLDVLCNIAGIGGSAHSTDESPSASTPCSR